MSEVVSVDIEYGGLTYTILLNKMDLPLPDGSVITHFEVVGAATGRGDVFRLGRRYLEERRVRKAVETGEITPEQAQRILAIANAEDVLPQRDRRVAKQIISRGTRGFAPTRLSAEVDNAAEIHFDQWMLGYEANAERTLAGFTVEDIARFLFLYLEAEASLFLRETDYRSALSVDDHQAHASARDVLDDPTSSDQDKQKAEQAIQDYEKTLDATYDAYYHCRSEAMSGGLSAEDVARKIENLRKSKNHPEGKSWARLLKTENVDASRYHPYFYGMQLVGIKLRSCGYLSDVPSRAFYQFVHSPHEYLSGIVPAIHPIYHLFLQSELFTRTVAEYGADQLDPEHAPSIHVVLRLCAAILGIIETYRTAVIERRNEESLKRAKVKHRRGDEETPDLSDEEDPNLGEEEAPTSGNEYSFVDAYGMDDVRSDAPRRPVATPEQARLELETDRRLEQQDRAPQIDEQALRDVFSEDQAKKVLTYMRRQGSFGHQKARTKDLAKEYGCDRTTIFRWAREGEKLMKEKAEENRIDWNALMETLSSRQTHPDDDIG